MKNMRFNFLITVFFLLSFHSLLSQCSPMNIVVNKIEPSCFGSFDGSVSIIDVLGGHPPYSYQWSNGYNDSIIDSLSSGVYSVLVIDSIGCIDSTFVNLNEPQEIINDMQISICNGDSIIIGNNSYNSNGLYNDTLVATNGCDSILTISLLVNPTSFSSETYTEVCDSLEWNGVYYTQSGSYDYYTINQYGCDSIVTLQLLSISNSSFSSQNIFSCTDVVSPSGNYVWVNSGVYIDTIYNNTGCDSIITINLTRSPPINIYTSSLNSTCYNLSNGSVSVDSISGGFGSYVVDWNGVDTNNLSQGTYTVIVSDIQGCSSTQDMTVLDVQIRFHLVSQTQCHLSLHHLMLIVLVQIMDLLLYLMILEIPLTHICGLMVPMTPL